jgi:hypothetical protein
LEETYHECFALREFGGLTALVENSVTENHEDASEDKRHGYHLYAFKHSVYGIAAEQTEYGCGDEGYEELPIEIVLVE